MASDAGARTADRQVVSDLFTSQVPDSSTGRTFAVDFFDPADPAAMPIPARKVVIELHPGARFDTNAVPQCKATDAELLILGPSACPAASQVGTNEVLIDHSFPPPGPRYTISDVKIFNDADALILLGESRGAPFIPRTLIRAPVSENRLEISAGFIPGTGPFGGARKRERADFPARDNFLTTPRKCPKSGFWTNHATYTYADGISQTSFTRSPCVKKHRRQSDDD
ncbi:MAG: hypothetical protein WKF96_18745 [Solirubrobacteraceae bacterium]